LRYFARHKASGGRCDEITKALIARQTDLVLRMKMGSTWRGAAPQYQKVEFAISGIHPTSFRQ
jgi:hypothetical protein